jgi:hypothetical protein
VHHGGGVRRVRRTTGLSRCAAPGPRRRRAPPRRARASASCSRPWRGTSTRPSTGGAQTGASRWRSPPGRWRSGSSTCGRARSRGPGRRARRSAPGRGRAGSMGSSAARPSRRSRPRRPRDAGRRGRTRAEGRYQAEYRIVPVGGPPQVILATGQTIYDDDGRPERMFGVAMDVTERREPSASSSGPRRWRPSGSSRGRRPRLQQHPVRDPRLRADGRGGPGPRPCVGPQVAQILKAGSTGGDAHAPAARVRPRQVLEPGARLERVVRRRGMLRRLIGRTSRSSSSPSPPAIVKVDRGRWSRCS